MVVLQKLREFQDAGHTVVLIIGDFTARIGDPSGQSVLRPVLEPEEIDRNAQTFQDQAFQVLDPERTEVRRNSEWLDMPMADLLRLVRGVTVARVMERDDFTQRIEQGRPISVLELLYPVTAGLRLGRRAARTSSSAAPTRSSTCCSAATSSRPTARSRRRCSRCRSCPGSTASGG